MPLKSSASANYLSTRLAKTKHLFIAFFICAFASLNGFAQNEFITEWEIPAGKTSFRYGGVGTNFTLVVEKPNGTVVSTITNVNSNQTIAVPAGGTYIVKASNGSGQLTGFRFNSPYDQWKWLKYVRQWGNIHWTSQLYFSACNAMDVIATDIPDLSGLTSLRDMFHNCSSLVGNDSFDQWDVSTITDMTKVFWGARSFNQPLNSWNTANVTSMNDMFSGATAFNQPLDNWNTGKVTDMGGMFHNPLDDVTTAFNQPLNSWNTANVTYMGGMFAGATAFNQPLDNWNTGKVTDMGAMFDGATAFNQPIGNWDTKSVQYMNDMFFGATAFNQPLDEWNTANVTSMNDMFNGATAFNQPLNSWNIGNVGKSELREGRSLGNMLDNSGMDCINYSRTLQGWAQAATTPDGISLGADNIIYSPEAQAARDILTGKKGWTITDAGAGTCTLPVSFGSVSAFVQNNQLVVNWSTLTEANNSKFLVEVSKTGVDGWKQVGEVQSKAPEGNSAAALNYNFTASMGTALGLIAIPTLLGLFVPAFSRRKKLVAGFLAILMAAGYFSCRKQELASELRAGDKIYVRIAQVDKDGAVKYSEVKQAVKK